MICSNTEMAPRFNSTLRQLAPLPRVPGQTRKSKVESVYDVPENEYVDIPEKEPDYLKVVESGYEAPVAHSTQPSMKSGKELGQSQAVRDSVIEYSYAIPHSN